jgi:hypothetical protein
VRPAGELPTAELSAGSAPKLLVADELDSDLPDELAAVAAQLRDEAATLARQHPPRAAEDPLGPTVKRRRRGLWLWPVAASILVTAGLLAWRIDHWPSAAVGPAAVTADRPSSQAAAATSKVVATKPPAERRPSAVDLELERLRAAQSVAEVGITDTQAPSHGTSDELSMLRRQVDGFEKLIHRFQAELVARDAAEAESQRRIEALQKENEELRQQLHK